MCAWLCEIIRSVLFLNPYFLCFFKICIDLYNVHLWIQGKQLKLQHKVNHNIILLKSSECSFGDASVFISSIKDNLFRCNLKASPSCSCGFLEDAYFELYFVCKKYTIAWISLMIKLLALRYVHIIDAHFLLRGEWFHKTLKIQDCTNFLEWMWLLLKKCVNL